MGGPTDGRDIVISDHYEAKKRQLKGHGWRFGETHESFSTASVSRPSAGATVGLFSARSGLLDAGIVMDRLMEPLGERFPATQSPSPEAG